MGNSCVTGDPKKFDCNLFVLLSVRIMQRAKECLVVSRAEMIFRNADSESEMIRSERVV